MTREELHKYWKTRNHAGENGVMKYFHGRKKSRYLVSLFGRAEINNKSSILELGCNVGRNLNELHEAGYKNIAGIDICGVAINKAKKHYPHLLKIVERSIEAFFTKPRSYDVIFSMAVLEHLPRESDSVFKQIAQAAKKNIITVEYEGLSDVPRIIQRDYKHIFEKLGFIQIFSEDITKIKSLNKYTTRIFKRK